MKQHQITYHNVPRETFSAVDKLIGIHKEKLELYLDRLLWWNSRINLVSRDVPRETVWQHIRHSLLLSQFEVYKNSSHIVDAGTGGGLPGLPLSIISEDKEFTLNDIVSKKILAVKQIARKIGLQNVTTFDKSIEEIKQSDPFLLISKHAFKIDDLFRLTSHLPWTEMVFYKGVEFNSEIEALDTPISISVYDLYEESEEEFYKDKAIVIASENID